MFYEKKYKSSLRFIITLLVEIVKETVCTEIIIVQS